MKISLVFLAVSPLVVSEGGGGGERGSDAKKHEGGTKSHQQGNGEGGISAEHRTWRNVVAIAEWQTPL